MIGNFCSQARVGVTSEYEKVGRVGLHGVVCAVRLEWVGDQSKDEKLLLKNADKLQTRKRRTVEVNYQTDNLTNKKNLAGAEGLEPAHAGIKIRCLNQLGDAPTRVTESIESTPSTTENSQLPRDIRFNLPNFSVGVLLNCCKV